MAKKHDVLLELRPIFESHIDAITDLDNKKQEIQNEIFFLLCENIEKYIDNEEVVRFMLNALYYRIECVSADYFHLIADIYKSKVNLEGVFNTTLECYCSRCGDFSEFEIFNRDGYMQDKFVCQECIIEIESEKEDAILYLKTMPYKHYLQTEHWKSIRSEAIKQADYKCQLCNKNAHLQVHHRTYENRGNEKSGDLIVLCKGCHAKFHNKLK